MSSTWPIASALEGMAGLPVTIRTVDIGSDKPLDKSSKDETHLNPALGLRAIRWCLADPDMFLTQLRAILRAAAFGRVNLLMPMLAHVSEIRQTLELLDQARAQLDKRGVAYGPLKLGAMIEIPAAALMLDVFLKYFDFLSIGTNDLIQYTLAIDRADESVAHLYDPLHPAVLRLVADTIARCNAQSKGVSVCGEMAGDVTFTRLLLGLGLRSFSMHPSQILAVKHEVLRADAGKLASWAQAVLDVGGPGGDLRRLSLRRPRVSARAGAQDGCADDHRRGQRDAPAERAGTAEHQHRGRRQAASGSSGCRSGVDRPVSAPCPTTGMPCPAAPGRQASAASSPGRRAPWRAPAAAWHSSDRMPETRPNRPTATVGKGGTRRVSSE